MNFYYFSKMDSEVKDFLNESNLLKEDSYYSSAVNNMINNRINSYVNYVNFKIVYEYFHKYNNLKILDLGCGSGDKCIFLKKFFPSFEIFGIETLNYDDPDHIEHKPYLFFKKVHEKIKQRFDIKFDFYNGLDLDVKDGFFDVILLYAVIEHISPEKRTDFINGISKKLKKDGYFVITRCPRNLGIMEFLSRRFNLGAHEWTLKKNELLGLFSKEKYAVEVFKRMNNVPNNYKFTKNIFYPLVIMDMILDFLRWPFSTDYFLIVRKK